MNGYVLSMFYSQGGKVVNMVSEEFRLETINCIFFQEKFNKRRSFKMLQERLITDYLRTEHEDFFDRFTMMIDYDGSNIFQGMFGYLETPNETSFDEKLLEELVDIIYHHVGEINNYLQNRVNEWNEQDDINNNIL